MSSKVLSKASALGSLSPWDTLSTWGPGAPQETLRVSEEEALGLPPFSSVDTPWLRPSLPGLIPVSRKMPRARVSSGSRGWGGIQPGGPQLELLTGQRGRSLSFPSLPRLPASPRPLVSPLPPSSYPLFLPLSSDHPALCSPPPHHSSVCLKGTIPLSYPLPFSIPINSTFL